MGAINNEIYEIVEKALANEEISQEELEQLYALETFSPEAFYVQWAGRKVAMEVSDGYAEVHAQIGLNGSPCPKNCHFCSFAACNKVRKGKLETSREDVIEYAKVYEEAGANLILVLSTANYGFEKLLDMCYEVRNVISKDMPLLANTGDMTLEETKALKKAGVNGIYHAVRLGEGVVTDIPVETRIQTIKHAQEAGLKLCTCVEPIGPEHTAKELAEATILLESFNPVSSGAGRRITVPGTKMEKHGMLSESRGALYAAVYRIYVGNKKEALMCSAHSMLTANAGANLAWAEVGANPRDTVAKTESGGKGQSIEDGGKVFLNTEWEIRKGFSPHWR